MIDPALSLNRALCVLTTVSCCLYVVVFSTRAWIGSDTFSLGIWRTCVDHTEGEDVEIAGGCQNTNEFVNNAQSDTWVPQTQVLLSFALVTSLLSTACIFSSSYRVLPMVDSAALTFAAMCSSFAAGLLCCIGVLVVGLRQAYDEMFRDAALQWSFALAVVTVVLFFTISFLSLLRFVIINNERMHVKNRRALAQTRILADADESVRRDHAPGSSSVPHPGGDHRRYTGAGVTHQPRPPTVGGREYRGQGAQQAMVTIHPPPPRDRWMQGTPPSVDPARRSGEATQKSINTAALFQVGTPARAIVEEKSQETSLVENSNTRQYPPPSTSSKDYNYENANPQREYENPSHSDEDLDENASSQEGSSFANHTPIEGEDEEEEIEMEDEDHYNKMKRREEYIKRKRLIGAEKNEDGAAAIANPESGVSEMQLSSATPPSPKITPRPLMPIGRLPPIQLTAKTNQKKRKGEKEQPSTPPVGDDLPREEKAVPKRRKKRDLSHVDYK